MVVTVDVIVVLISDVSTAHIAVIDEARGIDVEAGFVVMISTV